MLAVEKWARNINPMIAYFAMSHACIARERCEALLHIKERRVNSHQFPLPDLPSWFAMYSSRKPLLAYKRLIVGNSPQTDEILKLMSGFRGADKIIKRSPEKLLPIAITPESREHALRYWNERCGELFHEIRTEIDNSQSDLELQGKFRNALVKDELALSFYFLVYFPCQLFYSESPTHLYKKGLNGDIGAIENLLKLDPLILHDPKIGYQIQYVRLYGKANDHERLVEAITKNPTINYKNAADERRNTKSDAGAFILALAKSVNYPLKASQIRHLYDALANDYDGTIDDTDIESPESFDKTIRTKAAAVLKTYQVTENQK